MTKNDFCMGYCLEFAFALKDFFPYLEIGIISGFIKTRNKQIENVFQLENCHAVLMINKNFFIDVEGIMKFEHFSEIYKFSKFLTYKHKEELKKITLLLNEIDFNNKKIFGKNLHHLKIKNYIEYVNKNTFVFYEKLDTNEKYKNIFGKELDRRAIIKAKKYILENFNIKEIDNKIKHMLKY